MIICIVNYLVANPTCWWLLTVIKTTTNVPATLSKRDVVPETRAKLLDLNGYGPGPVCMAHL